MDAVHEVLQVKKNRAPQKEVTSRCEEQWQTNYKLNLKNIEKDGAHIHKTPNRSATIESVSSQS